VSLIDGNATTDSVIATVTVGSDPDDIAVDPLTNRVYIPNTGSNSVTVIDGTTNSDAVIDTINVGLSPQSVNLSQIANKLYVVNEFGGTLSIIDLGSNSVVATVPIGTEPNNLDIDEVANRIYIESILDGSITVIDGTTDQVIRVLIAGPPGEMVADSSRGRLYVISNIFFPNGSVNIFGNNAGAGREVRCELYQYQSETRRAATGFPVDSTLASV